MTPHRAPLATLLLILLAWMLLVAALLVLLLTPDPDRAPGRPRRTRPAATPLVWPA